MDSKQLMSLFIVALFLASSIGIGIQLSSGNNQDNQQDPTDVRGQPPQNQDQNLPLINQNRIEVFRSEEVTGRVQEINPNIILTARTEEAEKQSIDSAILQVKGVANLSSNYRQLPQQGLSGINLLYVAQISLDESQRTKREIVEEIQEKALMLFNFEVLSSALIEVPKKVKFISTEDESIQRIHEFDSNIVPGFVRLETEEQDEINLVEQASFNGEQLLQIIGIEVNNVTRTPVQESFQKTIKLKELKPRTIFTFEKTLPTLDVNSFKTGLEKLSDVNSVLIEAKKFNPIISIDLNSFDSNKINELSKAMEEVKDVNKVEANTLLNKPVILVAFNLDANYEELKQSIKQKFSDLNFSEYELNEPKQLIGVDASLKTKNAVEFKKQVIELLPLNASLKEFKQQALTELDSNQIQVNDKNYFLKQKSNEVNGFIEVGHKELEDLNALIEFIAVVNEIIVIEFREEK